MVTFHGLYIEYSSTTLKYRSNSVQIPFQTYFNYFNYYHNKFDIYWFKCKIQNSVYLVQLYAILFMDFILLA